MIEPKAMAYHQLTRRRWLRASTSLMLSVSSGGISLLAGCSADARFSGAAYAPWNLWNSESTHGTALALVAAGILAANPHDSQPWLFIATPDAIEIWADTSRNLGAMDPFLREMHLGLGCAIENMTLSAAANAYEVTVEPVPGSLMCIVSHQTRAHAATLRLTKLQAPLPTSALYAAIPHRHTNRYPYERARALPAAWHDAVTGLAADPDIRVRLFEEQPKRAEFDAVVIDATRAIIADANMIGDSDRWFRNSSAEIAAFRSGVTLETAGLSPFRLTMARFLPPLPPSATHDAWLALTRDRQVSTAHTTGIIAVRNRYDRPTTLAAGRAWQRLHLAATAVGVAMQPLNQPIEMIDRERQLAQPPLWERRVAALLDMKGWQATFAFRAGFATQMAPPSPRRAMSDALLT